MRVELSFDAVGLLAEESIASLHFSALWARYRRELRREHQVGKPSLLAPEAP